MNENIDLTVLLKDVPSGTKFYSPLFGEVEFLEIRTGTDAYPISTKTTDANQEAVYFTKEGKYHSYFSDAECMLFPSKDQRDWNVWAKENIKVQASLHPYDKVLVRNDKGVWRCDILSHYNGEMAPSPYVCVGNTWNQCIPYNHDTIKLLGTTDDCDLNYNINIINSII